MTVEEQQQAEEAHYFFTLASFENLVAAYGATRILVDLDRQTREGLFDAYSE